MKKKTGMIIGAIGVVLILFVVIAVVAQKGSRERGNSNYNVTVDNNVSDNTGASGRRAMPDGYIMKNKESLELGVPDTELDPQTVYSNLTYIPEMFYGNYRLRGGSEAAEKFGAESQYFTWTRNGEEIEFTKLPFEIRAGKATMTNMVNYIEEYNWMKLSFMHRYGENQCSSDAVLCAYTIDGNKLILKVLDSFEVDKETKKITYSFSDVTWEYTFAFSGRSLTLSTDDSSVTLTTGLDPYGTYDYFYVGNYRSPDSRSIDGIDEILFRYDSEDGDSRAYFRMADGESSHKSIVVLEENGLLTFTLALEESAKTYQFVYFYGGNDGLVLTDGVNTYYYNDTYEDRNKHILSDYLTEDQAEKLEELSDAQVESIVKKKENLMEDLAKAFNDAGIKVTVDEESGELAMDASVLFGGDSAELTVDGKAFLNKFVDAYTSIIFSEKYEGFVSKTVVEGHTAPVSGSTYESGLPLSEERAENVKNYCVSAETGIDTSKLAANLEAVGYSNSRPVIDADGNIDRAASRRVSFRFIINLDQE